MQAKNGAGLVVDHVLVVCGQEESGHCSVGSSGGFYHIRHVTLVGGLVEIIKLLMRELRVAIEIEVGSLRDSLQLPPTPRKLKFDITSAGRIVRKLVGVVRSYPQQLGGNT